MQLGFAGAQRLFGALALGQFLKAADGAFDAAQVILDRLNIHQHRNSGAVGLFDDKLGGGYTLAGAQRLRNRCRTEVQRLAVGAIAAQFAGKPHRRFAERQLTAP